MHATRGASTHGRATHEARDERTGMSRPQADAPRPNDRPPANEGAKSGNGAANGGASPPALPPRRMWLTFLLILAANFLLVHLFFPGPDDPVKVPYTLFKQEAARGNVERIYSRGERLTGRFRTPVPYPATQDTAATEPQRDVTDFTTTLP